MISPLMRFATCHFSRDFHIDECSKIVDSWNERYQKIDWWDICIRRKLVLGTIYFLTNKKFALTITSQFIIAVVFMNFFIRLWHCSWPKCCYLDHVKRTTMLPLCRHGSNMAVTSWVHWLLGRINRDQVPLHRLLVDPHRNQQPVMAGPTHQAKMCTYIWCNLPESNIFSAVFYLWTLLVDRDVPRQFRLGGV